MLVVTRKKDQTILIGDDIEITVIKLGRGQVKVGIKAPENLKVLRKEIRDDLRSNNLQLRRGSGLPMRSGNKV